MYAAAGQRSDPETYERATAILGEESLGLSAQVLAEFYTNVIRRPAVPLSPPEAFAWIERLAILPCTTNDAALVEIGIALSQRHKIDNWDAAILAAAERLGALVLYTEDLNHGQSYGSVRVENPFLAS